MGWGDWLLIALGLVGVGFALGLAAGAIADLPGAGDEREPCSDYDGD